MKDLIWGMTESQWTDFSLGLLVILTIVVFVLFLVFALIEGFRS